MRKCRNCLCRTCVNVCCDQKNCLGKKKECNRHIGFRQMSIFDTQELKSSKTPRHSWSYYGITKERYKELTAMIRSKEYAHIASSAAHRANETLSEYILSSVMEKRSYEGVEWLDGHRIPCGRTDFYGYRRLFLSLFDKELKKMEKHKNTGKDGNYE